jgi:hypothetical protein
MIIKNASKKVDINAYTTTDIDDTVQSVEKLEILDIAGFLKIINELKKVKQSRLL